MCYVIHYVQTKMFKGVVIKRYHYISVFKSVLCDLRKLKNEQDLYRIITMFIFTFPAGQRIAFNIWKEKAVTPLLLIHLGYGIGSLVTPLYANPFLADLPEETTENTTMYPNVTTTDPVSYASESKAEFPYAISAVVAGAVSFVFYFYQLRGCVSSSESNDVISETKTKDNEKTKAEKTSVDSVDTKKDSKSSFFTNLLKMVNPGTCAGGRCFYGSQILAFAFLYFGNIAGGDRMLGNFIRTYAIDRLNFTKTNASLLNTVFWIGFSAGRLTFSIVGFFVRVRILVLIETGGMAIAGVCLALFGENSYTGMWVLIISVGFFAAPTWPTGIAWVDYHIELTGLGMTWQILGASVGGIIHLRLIGYLYETFGPKSFLYQAMGICVLQLGLAIVLTLIGAQHGSRFKEKEDTITEVILPEEKIESTKL